MGDSFAGIFDTIGDSIDGLFNTAKDFLGTGSDGSDSSGGDFFGKKVAGAIFGGGSGSSSKSSGRSSVDLNMGQINRRLNQPKVTDTKPAAYADPRQIEQEWTYRLFKFANLDKLVTNTQGKLNGQ